MSPSSDEQGLIDDFESDDNDASFNTVPSTFNKDILSNFNIDLWHLLSTTVFEKQLLIQIIDDGDTAYVLHPDLDIFCCGRFPNPTGTSYRGLKTMVFADRFQEATNIEIPALKGRCFFLLGWLYKIHKSDTSSQRNTNYVVGLDVSDSTRSLWLIHFYERLYDDDRDDYGQDTHGFHPSDIAVSTFLDVTTPFDVGQICANFTDWDASRGLTTQQVRDCLNKASWRVGDALRLVPKIPPSDTPVASSRKLKPSSEQVPSGKLPEKTVPKKYYFPETKTEPNESSLKDRVKSLEKDLKFADEKIKQLAICTAKLDSALFQLSHKSQALVQDPTSKQVQLSINDIQRSADGAVEELAQKYPSLGQLMGSHDGNTKDWEAQEVHIGNLVGEGEDAS